MSGLHEAVKSRRVVVERSRDPGVSSRNSGNRIEPLPQAPTIVPITARHPATFHPGGRLQVALWLLIWDAAGFCASFLLAKSVQALFTAGPSTADALKVYFPLFLLFMLAKELYPALAFHPAEELRRIVSAITFTTLLILATSLLARSSRIHSYTLPVLVGIFAVIIVPLSRMLGRTIGGKYRWWGVPALILGAGASGARISRLIERHPEIGIRPVGMLDDDYLAHSERDSESRIPYLGPLREAPALARRYGIQYAILATSGNSSDNLSGIMEMYARCFPHILVVADVSGVSTLWVTARDLRGLPSFEINQVLTRPRARVLKRAFDLAGTLLISALFLPVFIAVYVGIRMTSSGGAFYGQQRVGLDGQPFTVWKFRTMELDADEILKTALSRDSALAAEWARFHKLRRDPRVTPLGRLLRKTSLDELPQLWNVLFGDMSLVGPRPIVKAEIPRYGNRYSLYARVRPGLTGLWQVSGRNNTTYEERTRLDDYYVRNWSLWLDVYLLARTVKTVLTGDGAY